jgi:hypothetical protein
MSLASRVLRAGLVVALLDALYLVVVFVWALDATTTQRVFQGIARAVLGQDAFSGGWGTAALGVGLHVCVALGWTSVWAIAYENNERVRRFTAETPTALVAGVAYGVFVWAAMRYVMLPLTHAPMAPLMSRGTGLVILAHILVIGPPLVLLVRRPLAHGEDGAGTYGATR